jgi:HSP20 family molecular chaperone IbpA
MAIDLWRTRPYTPSNLSSAVDRLFEQAFAPFSQPHNGGSTGYQSLPVNVWETTDGYHAALLAPGLDEQSLNVTVHEDTLSIEGEMRFDAPEEAKMVWQEFGPSHFRRSLRLGTAVDAAHVEAIYRNGLLLVTMPKAEHAKPRQIQVRLGDAAEGEKK